MADYDCTGEEVQRRRRGRARACDLWTQPGIEGGRVAEEEEAEDIGGEEEGGVEEQEAPVVVHRPILVIEEDNDRDGEEGTRGEDMDRSDRASAHPAGERLEEEEQEDEVDQEDEEVQNEEVAGGEEEGNDGDVANQDGGRQQDAGGENQENVDGVQEVEGAAGHPPQGDGRVLLHPYLQPHVPGPSPDPAVDGRGWSSIDSLGALESLLCQFGMLAEVPFQFEAGWRKAWETALLSWEQAETELEETRALKWMMFLPQALLRRPRRGGRKGRQAVAARFTALSDDNWGKIVEMWKEDIQYDHERELRRERRGRQQPDQEQKEKERLRREVLSLIKEGQVGRAMSRVTSFGVASSKDPEVQEQLLAKYPVRGRPLPASVTEGQAVENLRGLREALAGLQRGISPGCGGCRGEYLSLLAEQLEAEHMARLERFAMSYVQGKLPTWVYKVLQTLQAVALYKTGEQEAVRPLGLKHPLVKTIHREVIKQNRAALQKYLEPQQISLSSAGAPKLVISVRAQLEERRDFICLKLDLKNAFNEMSRAAIVEAFEAEPSLRHLAAFYGITLAPATALEAGGIVFGEGGEGEAQGDPKAGAGFCVGLQPSLVKLDNDCREGGGSAIGGADDIYAVGPAEVVLAAMASFKVEVLERCCLRLQLDKSSLFSWDGDLPEGTPADIQLAGEMVEGRFLRGFLCYGCPVGEEEYVGFKLRKIADRIMEDAQKTVEVLQLDRQALWSSLRASVAQRFDYWCQLALPSAVKPVAALLDKQLWLVLDAALGFKVPRRGELVGQDVDCILNQR